MPKPIVLSFSSTELAVLRYALGRLEKTTWDEVLRIEGELRMRADRRFPGVPEDTPKVDADRADKLVARRLEIQWEYLEEVTVLMRRIPVA